MVPPSKEVRSKPRRKVYTACTLLANCSIAFRSAPVFRLDSSDMVGQQAPDRVCSQPAGPPLMGEEWRIWGHPRPRQHSAAPSSYRPQSTPLVSHPSGSRRGLIHQALASRLQAPGRRSPPAPSFSFPPQPSLSSWKRGAQVHSQGELCPSPFIIYGSTNAASRFAVNPLGPHSWGTRKIV